MSEINAYMVHLEVRLENLSGNPTWESVAKALQQEVRKLGNKPVGGFRAGGGTVYVTDCDLDTPEEVEDDDT